MAEPGHGPRRDGIVMLGTSPATMGGISSVVRVYQQVGLLDRYDVRYLATHCDGGKRAKLAIHLRAWLAFCSLLIRGRVGLVHVHVSKRMSFWRKLTFIIPAWLARRPVLLHLHAGSFEDFYEQGCGPVRRRLVRWTFDHASYVVTLSAGWQSWVRQISHNPHVEVVHNPVVVPARDPRRGRLTRVATVATDRTNTVLMLGRLGQGKGTYDLLDATVLLQRSGLRVALRLAGDGELDAVAARGRELGLDVTILGWINAADRERELRNAEVYALPSYREGLPMSLLEAMAAGLPVVCTPVGGIPDAVSDGVEGYLVQPGDVERLAGRLATILSDPKLATAMGARARAKALEFSAVVTLPQIEAIYERLGFFAACETVLSTVPGLPR